jgi:hypothetical protein
MKMASDDQALEALRARVEALEAQPWHEVATQVIGTIHGVAESLGLLQWRVDQLDGGDVTPGSKYAGEAQVSGQNKPEVEVKIGPFGGTFVPGIEAGSYAVVLRQDNGAVVLVVGSGDPFNGSIVGLDADAARRVADLLLNK